MHFLRAYDHSVDGTVGDQEVEEPVRGCWSAWSGGSSLDPAVEMERGGLIPGLLEVEKTRVAERFYMEDGAKGEE